MYKYNHLYGTTILSPTYSHVRLFTIALEYKIIVHRQLHCRSYGFLPQPIVYIFCTSAYHFWDNNFGQFTQFYHLGVYQRTNRKIFGSRPSTAAANSASFASRAHAASDLSTSDRQVFVSASRSARELRTARRRDRREDMTSEDWRWG